MFPISRQPISKICYVCSIQYEYILETANLSEELAFLLKLKGISPPKVERKNKAEGRNNQNPNFRGQRKTALQGLPKETFNTFIERYRDDYDLFGMAIPSFEDIAKMYQ